MAVSNLNISKLIDYSNIEEVINGNFSVSKEMKKTILIWENYKKEMRNEYIPVIEKTTTKKDIISSSKDENEEYDYYLSNIKSILKKPKDRLQNQQQIIESLPSIENKKYGNIVKRIILDLKREILEIKTFIESCDKEDELIQYFQQDITNIEEMITIIKTLQNLDSEILIEKAKSVKNKLVFFETHGGSIYVENDLNSINIEYYNLFEELLRSIENGTFKNIKRLKSNTITNGTLELKNHEGVRMLFSKLNNDTYVIICCFIKKVDTSNGYLKFIFNRISRFKEKEEEIIKNIEDKEYLEKQQEITESLFKGLTNKKITKIKERNF